MMPSFGDLSHSALSHLGLVTKQWQAFKRPTFCCKKANQNTLLHWVFSIVCRGLNMCVGTVLVTKVGLPSPTAERSAVTDRSSLV